MSELRRLLRGLPVPARWASVAAMSAGGAGAVAGLVIGLLAYAPTAPFAMFEVGFPATIVGGVIGLAAGTVTTAIRRIRRPGASSL